MASDTRNEYVPDTVSPPGETLAETIQALGMTQAELAERAGRPAKTINEIVRGKAALTPETAIQLERVLGVPARFWQVREQHYREYLARKDDDIQLESDAHWLDEVPYDAMVRLGWVASVERPVDRVRLMLQFFGIARPRPWSKLCPEAAYRNAEAFTSCPASVAAWLRRGELEARDVVATRFSEASLRPALPALRTITRSAGASRPVPELKRICAEAGIVALFVPELPGTRLLGAARFLGGGQALVQLSLRHTTDDQMWFTFFHEVGHVLLHGRRGYSVDTDGGTSDAREEDANAFARDTLVVPGRYAAFVQSRRFTRDTIERFAATVGVAPGIVVGRLQHDGLLSRRFHNGLKVQLSLSDR